jgi:hypothetical protein
MTGLAFIFDYVIFILLNAYVYKPHIFKEQWLDSGFGSVVSQGVAVPIVATFLVVFKLRWYWYPIFTFLFIGIETWFTLINLYEQYWWRFTYTFLFILFAFLIAHWWYKKLNNPNAIVKFLTTYMTIITIENLVMLYLYVFVETHIFELGWFSDTVRDHVATNALYIFVYSLLFAYTCCKPIRCLSITAIVFFEYTVYYLLVGQGLLVLSTNWRITYFVILAVLIILIYRFIYKRVFHFTSIV